MKWFRKNPSAAVYASLSSLCVLPFLFALPVQGQLAKNNSFVTPAAMEERLDTHAPDHAVVKVSPETQGDIFMANRRYVDAINSYKLGPSDSAVIYNKIGVAYHHLYGFQEAKLYYERAIKLNSKYAEALNNLGTIYYERKEYGKAERLYRKVLKLSPNSPITLSNLGTAYFAHHKYSQGEEAYHRAMSMDPEIFERDSLGKIEHQGSPEQRAAVSYYLARAYAQAGMQEQALKFLRRAFSNGFTDSKKLLEDKEFSSLRKTEEFQKLMEEENIHLPS